MKKIISIFVFLIAVLNIIEAQSPADTTDPLFGNYSLETSSELFFQYAPTSENQNRVIYDFTNTGLVEKFRDNSHANGGGGFRAMDVVVGDFNGDYADDIISAWQSAQNWMTDYYPLTLSIPKLISDSLKWTRQIDTIVATDCGNSIRLISGSFDYDNPDEFILAYMNTDYNIKIILYEIDTAYALKELDNIVVAGGNDNAWDICADDFDGDGLDELVIVNPFKADINSKGDICTLLSLISTYDFFQSAEGFKLKSTNIISTENKIANSSLVFKNLPAIINEVAVATGNFDDDANKEVVYSYEISASVMKFTIKLNRLSFFDILDKDLQETVETADGEYVTVDHVIQDEDGGYFGYTVDVQTADVDKNGKDEVFAFSDGELRCMKLNPSEWFLWDEAYSKYRFNSHNLLAVRDIDADTANESSLTPEVVLLSFINQTATITIYKLSVDTVLDRIEEPYDSRIRINTGLASNNLYTCAIALGDFDGDGIHLGKPKRLVKNSVFIPTVIINAPPSHFDILNSITYDVNFFYSPWSPSCPKPVTATTYKQTSKQTVTCATELKKDWKISAEFATDLKIPGIGVGLKTKLTSDYGEKFSNKVENTKSYTITESATADRDDFMFGMSVNYYLFEYPLLFKGENYGNLLVSSPVRRETMGKYSKNLSEYFNTYSLKHETNNLLSYPYYNNIGENSDLVDLKNGSGSIFGVTRDLSNVLNTQGWTLSMSEIKSENISSSYEFNVGMDVSVSKWGCSLGLKGEYGREGLTSHTTSLEEGIEVSAVFDRIDANIGLVEYTLQPYVYWSKSGALVIDYNVDLTGRWWRDMYGTKPDLAFILPYRYSPEKGQKLGPDESMRMLTSDIRYFPFDAKPGDSDSIIIMAVVRNFSILDSIIGETTIDFYLGDPADNGELIKSLPVYNIAPRNFSIVQFKWKIPENIPPNPWIFAVIDPHDKISEIHSDNNKGWIPLFGSDKYPPYISTGLEVINKTNNFDLSNYPNPAHTETMVFFNLYENKNANLNIFNSLGQPIEQRIIKNGSSGLQYLLIDVSAYAPGIYFYQLSSGNLKATKKMIVE